MKVIYEDGNDRNEAEEVSSGNFEFEDISSDSVRAPGAKKPVRPVRRPAPTLRQNKQSNKEPAQEPPQYAGVQQPVFSNPYPQGVPAGYVPVQPYPQGYMPNPEQLAAMPQYPQGYVPYPNMQQYPQGYMPAPYPPYQNPAPAVQQPVTEHNPGTRVLYQSPDFENFEAERSAPVYTQPTVQRGIVHEDVDYSSEPVPSTKSKPKSKAQKTQVVCKL